MHYINYNNEQYIFDRCINGIFIVVKLCLKAVIYFPLLLTGYVVANTILNKKDSGIIWVASIIVFAFILYLFIFFLKGIFIAWRSKGNLLWILLFILCVTYTTIAPVWLGFETIEKIMFRVSKQQAIPLTWLFGFAYGYYTYTRYQFLANVAPLIAGPAYQMGINFGLYLCRIV